MIRGIPRSIPFLVAVAAVLLCSCGEHSVESIWRDRDIAIDGRDDGDEWKGARYILDDQKIVLGVMNDSENLYIRFSSLDRDNVLKMLVYGFVAWFDGPQGKRTFGVLYPLGRAGGRRQESGAQGPSEPAESAEASGKPSAVDVAALVGTDIIVIENEGKKHTRLTLDQAVAAGIRCTIGENGGRYVYELAVPLYHEEGVPYSLSKEPIETIIVTLQSGALSSSRGSTSSRNSGMGGGGMGGGGMGGMDEGGSGRRGGMSQRQPAISEPLQLKLNIKLAKDPAAS